MTSAAKLQKDKFYGSTSRLTPRPTAASMARAARNATNRSQTSSTSQKSPSRTTTCLSKTKCGSQRSYLKSESTTNIKIANRCSETDIPSIEDVETNEECNVVTKQETGDPETSVTDNPSEVVTEEQSIDYSADSIGTQETQDLSIKIKDDDDEKIEKDVDVNQFPENETKNTEPSSTISSRPQTPKSLQSNRPQTPRKPSRPATPANPSQGNMTTTSRPSTPHKSSLPRPKTSSALRSSSEPEAPATNSQALNQTFNTDYDNIVTVYTTKQKTFLGMKKELDLKQQAILEMFNDLQSLRDHMVKEGISSAGEGLKQKELVIINVADWAAEEVAQLCRNTSHTAEGATEIINTVVAIDENILAELESKMLNLPEGFGDLCLQAFTARQELIDWVQKIIANQDTMKEEDLGRITLYNRQAFEHCDHLRYLKNQADECVNGVTALLKQAWLERGVLITVGESLVKELAQLRQDIQLHTAVTKELNAINTAESEKTKALEDTRRELEDERATKANIKEKLVATEVQLRQARMRVSKMDRQLREAEASISSLTGTVKSLEDQSAKEVQLEARARKLKESLKTGEVSSNQLMQQRDALQNELTQLKEQLERSTIENKSTIQELNNQLRHLKSSLEVEKNKTHEEMELKNMFEESYRESLNTIEEMKAQIAQLENNKPNPDLPTEKEMDLRAELLATKDTLRMTEEEVIACKREKVHFLETLTKIAESENKVGLQPKLIAELQSKEEIMSKMQTQIRELTKGIKLNEQKVIQYEQYVRDLQAYTQDSANCQESPVGVSYQDLQQEIMHLRMGLLEAVHRNEELTETLMQKEQQLEQQDKTSRAQARVIKIREDLVNMLKNKEMEQSRELSTLQQDLEHRMKIVDEVNKQIAAKAEEIQELFSTLESKQQQIHRLEKIVLALEEQQRRAQAQRTRHEEKIAALEHELSANGNRRERKFLFF